MKSRPLVYITLAFAVGIALSGTLDPPPPACFISALAATVLTAVIFFIFKRDVFFALLVVFFLLGAALESPGRVSPGHPAERFLGLMVTLEGYVCRDPDVRGDGTVYEIEVEKVFYGGGLFNTGGRVLLRIPGRKTDFGYGDAVRVEGRPYLPAAPGNPGQFNYGKYLSSRGIWALINVKERESVEKIASGRGNPLAGAALRAKQRLVEVAGATLDPAHAALVNGIVFGSRGDIDRDTREVFNEAGVVHILSVSGLHVGLVAAGVMGLLGLAGLQRFSFPVLTAVLIAYTYITGMGPAVTRAALMAWIYLLGNRLGRERDWPTTLAAPALIILAFSPGSLFEPGFQLSFGATWGILHVGRAIDKGLESAGIARPWVRGCLSVTLGAQAGILPLVAYYYNLFSLVSVPANLLAVPLVGLILPLGMLAALGGLLHLKIALVINFATEALLDLMLLVVNLVHSLPGGVYYIVAPPAAATALWYVSLALLARERGPGEKPPFLLRKVMAGLLVLSLAVPIWGAVVQGGGELRVHVLDVGQGDSILIRFPNGKNMLVDAGGWKEEFREGRGAGEVVASYLRRLGIKELDALVLTHPHEDHAAGAGYLMGRFKIGAVLISPAGLGEDSLEPLDPAYRRILGRFKEMKVPVREVYSGEMIALDQRVQVEVLGPGPDILIGTGSDLNNNSVVLSVRYGEKSFLLTGDIEIEGQARLLERGAGLRHSVLKAPHHGSRYLLPEFVGRVQPEVSVVSVGRNSFGQPDPTALSLLSAGGRPVYRTDRDGLVMFSCDGRKIRVAVTGK